jgi:hypothetical protein
MSIQEFIIESSLCVVCYMVFLISTIIFVSLVTNGDHKRCTKIVIWLHFIPLLIMISIVVSFTMLVLMIELLKVF